MENVSQLRIDGAPVTAPRAIDDREARFANDVSRLDDLLRHDWPDSDAVVRIEQRILNATPQNMEEAAVIAAVASSWVLADLKPEMIERARSAMKRVASFLEKLPPNLVLYYGLPRRTRKAA